MIVGTPRPGSPTIRAQAPWSSSSLDAFERLPSLSFSRCRRKPSLRAPSGRTRGSAKQLSPSPVWARTRKRSHIGAEQNHLCPVELERAVLGERRGAGRVGAHVRAALPLGHGHAAQRRALLAGRAQRRVVARGRQQRHPLGGDVGLRPQRGNGRERHRDRAAEAGLGLDGALVERGADHVGARPMRRPGKGMQSVRAPPPPSARARRGGTRPRRGGRRSGRGCAGRAGGRWPQSPSAWARHPRRRRPRAGARAPGRRPRARAPRRAGRCRRRDRGPRAAGPG